MKTPPNALPLSLVAVATGSSVGIASTETPAEIGPFLSGRTTPLRVLLTGEIVKRYNAHPAAIAALHAAFPVVTAEATEAKRAAHTFPNAPGNGDFRRMARTLGECAETIRAVLVSHDGETSSPAPRDTLADLLIECLPYVTDAIDDPAFKPSAKPAIRGLVQRVRNALEG